MTLIKSKYEYSSITRESVDGKRLYACPDGSKLPSVTTILDRTKPPEKVAALAAWRKSVGEKKAQEITTEAASRGSRMHKYLEDYMLTGELKAPGSNPFSQQSHKMAQTVIKRGLVNLDEVWGVEIPLYYPGLYAGTTDGAGIHLSQECIFDHKQTNKVKKEEYIDDYYIQLTAYSLAHNKVYDTNIRKGVIFMCSADFQYQEFILTPDKFNYWEDIWWSRVEQYYKEN